MALAAEGGSAKAKAKGKAKSSKGDQSTPTGGATPAEAAPAAQGQDSGKGKGQKKGKEKKSGGEGKGDQSGSGKGAEKYRKSDGPNGQDACAKFVTTRSCALGDKCKFWHAEVQEGKKGFCSFYQDLKKACGRQNCPYQHVGLGPTAAKALRVRNQSNSPTPAGGSALPSLDA